MKVVVNYDTDSKSDIKTFLTRKSALEEVGYVIKKHRLRAVCISEGFINCMARSRDYDGLWFTTK